MTPPLKNNAPSPRGDYYSDPWKAPIPFIQGKLIPLAENLSDEAPQPKKSKNRSPQAATFSRVLPKLTPAEQKRLATALFAAHYREALTRALSPSELSLPLGRDKIAKYQNDESRRLRILEEDTNMMVSTGATLGIPASIRETMITNIYKHAFYQTTANLEHLIKNKMLESAIDPEGLFSFDKDGIRLQWAGESLRLEVLEELARLGGLSAKDIAAEMKRLHHEFKAANALLLLADVSQGVLNQYKYTLPWPCVPGSPIIKCRTWKGMLQPESWWEDFVAPMERGALRYFYIY